ncbi:MAG: Na/Pi cotransporter family protein [Clostridiales bacterium]|nr:Na/Pi cotransporter family protein [Clostridiales bacterium]
MKLTDIMGLLGGLALFLYGMRLMGEGLELLAGAKLKAILEKLTKNRLMTMLVGLTVTALIQSSNAVTAMAVSFVNLGVLEFTSAIGVIMGSNIGTTVTGQLIAVNFSAIAPLFALVGVVLFLFTKKAKSHYAGQVLAGFGILFIGMTTMSTSMVPLREVAWFRDTMTSFTNPLLGILVGAVFTLLIQSSSASVGVLQALASQRLISLNSAIYVICGQNIGCTIAAVMAAIGGTKNAKRTALVHVLFNVTGTILFVAATRLLPIISWMEALTPDNGMAQIANAHTIFNIATTLLLLPCSNLLARVATILIPGEDKKKGPQLAYIKDISTSGSFGASTIAIEQVEHETTRMFTLASDNLHAALKAFLDERSGDLETIYKNEEIIDFLNKEITRALVRINSMELTHSDAKRMSAMYHIISDIERIGDHAENIADYAKFIRERGTRFSAEASDELRELSREVYAMMDWTYAHFQSPTDELFQQIDNLEERIDDTVDQLQNNHIARLEADKCSADLGMIFVEILTDLERISDHALNIAQAGHKNK